MALEFVGGKSANGTSADFAISLTSLVGGISATAATGDLVIVATGFSRTLSSANPGVATSGYTEVADIAGNDIRDAQFSVNWKLMGGTPDTSVTCLGSGDASLGSVGIVYVWRNADQLTPLDVTRATVTGANSAIPDAPAITPVTAGSVVVATGLGTGAASDAIVTAPSGYTNAFNTSSSGALSEHAIIGVASKAWSGSGAEDPPAWTGWTTSTSDSWAAVTLAIRPAADGATYTLTAAQGSFTLTGQTTNLKAARKLTAGSGSFSLTGQTTNLKKGYAFSVSQASFVLSGQTATFQATRKLTASQGSFSLSGQTANLKRGYTFTAAQGSFALTGQTTTFSIGAVATYYLDASDAAISDPNSVWSNDANAFNGNTTDSASTATTGSTLSNFLLGEGTNAPTSGGTITQVRARVYALNGGDTPGTTSAVIYSNGLGELLGTATRIGSLGVAGYGNYITLNTPSGGWTWQKVNDLETKIYLSGGEEPSSNVYKVEVEVTFNNSAVSLTAAQGLVSVTGGVTNFLRGLVFSLEQGVFNLTGQAVSFAQDEVMTAIYGTFTVTAQSANMVVSRVLRATHAAISLTGHNMNVKVGRLLTAIHRTYTLSGKDIEIRADRLLNTDNGAFALAGQTVGFISSGVLIGAQANFILSGQDANFILTQTEPSVIPRRMLMGVGI
jgi:hypothetical protein